MNEESNKKTPTPPATSPDELSRRRFFARLSIILGGVGTLILTVPLVGFVMAPLFRKAERVWRPVGKVGQFRIGETVSVAFEDASALPWAGVAARSAAWLRRTSENEFMAFTINCTHLGCPVRWLPDAKLFMCPCHGGVYYQDGTVAAGPPPAPLTRYQVRVRDGEVEIKPEPIPISNQ